MTTNEIRVERSFRRGLATYHHAAVAQAQIAEWLMDALQDAGAPTRFGRVFEFGCGTGHLTAQILRRCGVDDLTLNDLVADCAQALAPILQDQTRRVAFLAGDIDSTPVPKALDLVASASTVQWVQRPDTLLARLAAHLVPGGWMAISGYGRGHFGELRSAGVANVAPSYLDPDDWRAILPQSLRLHHLAERPLRISFPDAVSLLRHLRGTGVNAGRGQHWTRADLAAFEAKLRAALPRGADLGLTYCPVMLIAQKVS